MAQKHKITMVGTVHQNKKKDFTRNKIGQKR